MTDLPDSKPPALSPSVFRDIHPEQLPQFIKEAKTVVMEDLREHLNQASDLSECDSLAFTLGTLRELERIVNRWRGGTPVPR